MPYEGTTIALLAEIRGMKQLYHEQLTAIDYRGFHNFTLDFYQGESSASQSSIQGTEARHRAQVSTNQTQNMGNSDHGVLDVRTFLSGLRSISLRNLSIRKRLSSGERELPSVTSANLSNLQAIIYLDEPDSTEPASGVSLGGLETVSINGVAKKALIITGVSQPTINPTWSIPETSWLHAGVNTEELEGAKTLHLRVFASSDRPRSSGHGCGDVDPVGQMVWETVIDMKALTALPEGLRLSDLGALPADCLLLEMSKGGLYVPAWVIKALESNSALPKAVIGRGGAGSDAWRDESDSEEGEEQAPLEEVLRKVQAIEREAERGRQELAAWLEKEGGKERRAFDTVRSENLLDRLKQDRHALQGLLKEEEAFLEKEKGHLQTEMQAVEELLKEVGDATDAADADARKLAVERREATKSHVLLEARRGRLTAELQAIYPIKYQEKLGAYTIRGLEVPADLYSVDDEKISSALGYTAHLVCMLAKYLQVPLRYQLIYNASRSAVRDNVTGAGVAYPLFRRGVEKERFDRGVQLLGRDVEQMLIARGVPVKRGTGQILRNLERLMSVEGV